MRYTNQILIRSSGDRADYGTITATDEEFFFPWKDIFPERYREFTPPLGFVREQQTLIQGMLPKATLLDLVRNCTVFMDVGKVRAKVSDTHKSRSSVDGSRPLNGMPPSLIRTVLTQ